MISSATSISIRFLNLQSDTDVWVYGISSCPNLYPIGNPYGFLCSFIDGPDRIVTDAKGIVHFQASKRIQYATFQLLCEKGTYL